MEKTGALSTLSALGHENRIDIFRLLIGAGRTGLFAGDIAQKLDIKANTLSAHLSVLASNGLVYFEREGRNIRYYARMESMGLLLRYLMEDCCGGSRDMSEGVCERLGLPPECASRSMT
jgi:DNA-binding transcriptional ArsR family regulator